MASKGKITEIADIQAIQKQIDTINSGLGTVVKSLETVTANSLKVNESFGSSKGIKDLTEAQKNLSKEQREAEIHAQKLAKEAANREKAELNLANAVSKQNKQTNEQISAYKALSQQLNEARAKAKDLAVEFGINSKQAKEAAKGVNELDSKLKAIDSSLGQNQRNVGNYKDALSNLAGKFGNAGESVIGFGKQLLSLLANPIVLIIAGIAAAVGLLVKAMNSNGEATEKMNQVLAPFKAILGAVFNVLGKVVGTFLDGVLAVQKFATAIISIIPGMEGVADATNKQIQLEKERQKLAEEERADIVSDSKDRLRVAELKKELARSDKYTAEQRIAMAREIDKIEKANMLDDVNRQIRRHNLLIAQMKSEGKTYKDLTEDQKQAFRESQAKINDLRAEYLDKTKKVGAKESALVEEIESDRKAKAKEAAERVAEIRKKQLEDEKKLRDLRTSLIKDDAEREKAILKNKYTDEYNANKGNKEIQKALTDKYESDLLNLRKKSDEEQINSLKNVGLKSKESTLGTFENSKNLLVKSKNEGIKTLEELENEEIARDEKRALRKKQIYEASANAISDIFGGIVSLQNAAYETDLMKLDEKAKKDEEAKEKELKAAGNNEELKEKINKKYEAKEKEREKERRKIEIEKAKFQKQAAIFGIILDTAKAIASHLTQPWLIPFDVLTGGVQLAVAAAQPLPKYKSGRKGGKAELAIVGEAGQEAIRLKSGETYLTPKKETKMFLPDGASVIPNHELMKNLSYKELPANIRNEKHSFSELIPFLSNISDTVKNKKETHLNITESGFYTIVKNGNSQTTYVNNKFKS